jgi:putative membrane protein
LQAGTFRHSSMWLRVWNEVASVILVAIVFIIKLKDNSSNMWIAVSMVIFAAALYLGIQLYKKSRLKAEEEEKGKQGE